MKCETLFRSGDHRWLVFGQDPDRPANVIDTNQYVICNGANAMMLDPGGLEVFPPMMASLTHEVALEEIRAIFLSHQDPDIGSSLPLWRRICPPDVKIYLSTLWSGFLSHFDRGAQFTTIPDEGMEVLLGSDLRLRFIPAHYLHSSGNFNVYDPAARILFSGDLGAALIPESARTGTMFVTDFNAHIPFMDGFHRRWMGSTRARDAWLAAVSKLDIDILAPQHGLLFQGDDVKRFLDWLAGLDIGSGVAAMQR
ncbi:MAG: MBL fold metallo-hydrolase [Magnetospirillum sp.]|nr:MBL fold metallo-hydrolase [Magnetospirillum sp.]